MSLIKTFQPALEQACLAYFDTLLSPLYLDKAGAYLVDSLVSFPQNYKAATVGCGSGAVSFSVGRRMAELAAAGLVEKDVYIVGRNVPARMPFASYFTPFYAAYIQKQGLDSSLIDPKLDESQQIAGVFKAVYQKLTKGRDAEADFVIHVDEPPLMKSVHTQAQIWNAAAMGVGQYDLVRHVSVPYAPRRTQGTGYHEMEKGKFGANIVLIPDMAWPVEAGITYKTWKDFSIVRAVVIREYLLMKGYLGKGGKYAGYFNDFVPEEAASRVAQVAQAQNKVVQLRPQGPA